MQILALDLGGTAIKCALSDENGRLSEQREVPSEGKLGGARLLQNAFALADSYTGFARIGISTTGQVDVTQGSIVFANENVPDYTGMQVGRLFSERYSVPVAVENDVNAAALGEAHFGAGRGIPDFLCLTYGTGVGGGIILSGRVFHGANGVAGEMGHIITHARGRACNCGQHGCYERYASTTALTKAACAVRADCQNGRAIFAAMQEGDLQIKRVVDEWIGEIVVGLASLVHVFNPSKLVLGGGIMRERYVIEQVRGELGKSIMPGYRAVAVEGAKLGNNAGVLGAVSLALSIE